MIMKGEAAMVSIWIVWWMNREGDSPEITVFVDQDKAYECWAQHKPTAYKCDMEYHKIYFD